MKKWVKFFFLSFFSHKAAKEAARRGYGNAFLGFLLALAFLWSGFMGADALSFGPHYRSSPDFMATAHAVLANADSDARLMAEIQDGSLRVKGKNGEYAEGLLINTLERAEDREIYSVNGYGVVVDLRPADTPAEIEAYCLSNDGKETVISYEDYLTLSEVARLNFDFKIKYTGASLELTDERVKEYSEYLEGLGEESASKLEGLKKDLQDNKITAAEYARAVYELYFVNYYPEISAYERSSKIPLLRNYYYHQYISAGVTKYLFIFDDYMVGSFETKGGVETSFYGFYSSLENGAVVGGGAGQAEAKAAVDGFIKNSFKETLILNAYAYLMNVLSLAPFIALMLMVAALLTYSVLKLRGVESVTTLGAMVKIVGSFVWFSGAASAVASVICSFFVRRSLMNVLPLVLFFLALVARSVIFAVKENMLQAKQSEQQPEQTEV